MVEWLDREVAHQVDKFEERIAIVHPAHTQMKLDLKEIQKLNLFPILAVLGF